MAASPSSSDPAADGAGDGDLPIADGDLPVVDAANGGALRVSLRARVPGGRAPEPTGRVVHVLVDPLYVATAAALALDAGWGAVELDERTDAAPIPLVSFEQPPAPEHRGATCRVRGDVAGIRAALERLDASNEPTVLLGAPAFARPLASRLAFQGFDAVEFVPVAAEGGLSADAWWASGMLMRVLLDELEVRDAVLDEAAGIAVSLVGELGDAAPALGAGRRWDAHLAAGGHADDLRIACAVDSIGVVPRLDLPTPDSPGLVARPW